MNETALGCAPTSLGHTTERLFLAYERSPGLENWVVARFHPERAVVNVGGNDKIPTAEIVVGLAWDFTEPRPSPDMRDWQILGGGEAPENPWDVLLAGRRIQIRTWRESEYDDWILFDGYVERVQLGWSGSGKTSRNLTVHAVSTIVAADREQNQWIFGQWRRSRTATLPFLEMGEGSPPPSSEVSRECVCVTACPCIFNPGGKPNCDPYPLVFADGSKVYVFTDADAPGAIPWTQATILRYIEWAALQPGFPLDEPTGDARRVSNTTNGVYDLLEEGWTSVHLHHWNLDSLIKKFCGETSPDTLPAVNKTMQREPSNLAVEGMTVLEAFAFAAEDAGMLMHVHHDWLTIDVRDVQVHRVGLWFSIRGARLERDPVSGGSGESPTGKFAPGGKQTPMTRGIYIWVQSDNSGAPGSAYTAFSQGSACEGSILIDESNTRPGVFVMGAATEIEVAADLLPGWQPQVDWDDVEDVTLAQSYTATEAWAQSFVRSRSVNPFLEEGRVWTWNEDGSYRASEYKRETGPWSTDASWEPVRFSTDVHYVGLAQRGDGGYCCRRRTFKPTRAEIKRSALDRGMPVDVMLEVSFNSGLEGSWWYLAAEQQLEPDRATIILNVDDLRTIVQPEEGLDAPAADGPTGPLTFPQAYIQGTLRLRIHANVETDDALLAFAQPSQESFVERNWWERVDQGNRQRLLRHKPGGGAIANSWLGDSGLAGDKPNQDPHAEAVQLAEKTRNEMERRRYSGQWTVPWLWRDGYGPTQGYRIGDEVIGLRTGDAATYLHMPGTQGAAWASSRIIGITWEWSAAGQATTFRLEDRVYETDDVGELNSGNEES